jgi:hypothetical protein
MGKERSEREIIENSHRSVIPDSSYRIPEFHRNFRNSTIIPRIPMKFYAIFPGTVNANFRFPCIQWERIKKIIRTHCIQGKRKLAFTVPEFFKEFLKEFQK